MPGRSETVSQQVLSELLTRQLADRCPPQAGTQVIDVGGGTGITAAALARLGYTVTVIDPSPDALASLARRSGEQGVADRVRGVQGDAGDLADLVDPGSVDVVVCHRVLEVVDSPREALAAIAGILRPGGLLSLVVAQGPAAVLAQGLAGHFAQARRLLADPRRLRYDQVVDFVAAAGLTVESAHGVGAIADHVPESLAEAGQADLLALEVDLGQDGVFRAIAPQLHVLAARPAT